VKGGRFVFPEAAEQLSVNELSTLSKILPIPRSYLYDKYSIPVPKDNEPVAGEKQPGQEDDGTSTGESRKEDEDEGKKTPTAKPKTKKRLRIFRARPDEGAGLADEVNRQYYGTGNPRR